MQRCNNYRERRGLGIEGYRDRCIEGEIGVEGWKEEGYI